MRLSQDTFVRQCLDLHWNFEAVHGPDVAAVCSALARIVSTTEGAFGHWLATIDAEEAKRVKSAVDPVLDAFQRDVSTLLSIFVALNEPDVAKQDDLFSACERQFSNILEVMGKVRA